MHHQFFKGAHNTYFFEVFELEDKETQRKNEAFFEFNGMIERKLEGMEQSTQEAKLLRYWPLILCSIAM